jgi:hypothetical protein
MSFKRLEADDFVISSDSITAAMWVGNVPTLTYFFTSSVQAVGQSGNYYLNVYSSSAAQDIQFAIAYGNTNGSGSTLYNDAVNGLSYTSTIFGQYQNLVLGDENASFIFGNVTSSDFWAISVERNRYKEALFPGSLFLELSGSLGVINLTDDSNYVNTTVFTEAGRVFNLISASSAGTIAPGAGTTNTGINGDGWSINSGSYGWLLPDIGTIILNPTALTGSLAAGGIGLNVSRSFDAPGNNNARLFRAISGSTASTFTLNSQETITSDFIFVRPRSSEYNYSENPSFISGSTGEVLYSSFVDNPQVYITTIGLYNDTNELLAVAKLSRPLLKDFTKEALIRVKLDF